MSDTEYVYGWGSRKHIKDRHVEGRSDQGLCGATGGYWRDEPQRKTCVKCLKLAGQRPCTHCDGTGIEPAPPDKEAPQ